MLLVASEEFIRDVDMGKIWIRPLYWMQKVIEKGDSFHIPLASKDDYMVHGQLQNFLTVIVALFHYEWNIG